MLTLVQPTWRCSSCGETKPESEFHRAVKAGRKRQVQAQCKLCQANRATTPERKAVAAAWKKANREKLNAYHREYYHTKTKHSEVATAARNEYARWRRRLIKYGVTKEQFEAMLAAQDGKCAICGVEQWLDLRVDHDHHSGRVRALLCNNCNTGIGLLQESEDVVVAALRYLQCQKRMTDPKE